MIREVLVQVALETIVQYRRTAWSGWEHGGRGRRAASELRRQCRYQIDDRALRPQHTNRVVHDGRAIGRKRRYRDACAVQRVRVEELRVVVETVARREARRGCGIVLIEPGDHTEHDRRVSDRSPEWAGRI